MIAVLGLHDSDRRTLVDPQDIVAPFALVAAWDVALDAHLAVGKVVVGRKSDFEVVVTLFHRLPNLGFHSNLFRIPFGFESGGDIQVLDILLRHFAMVKNLTHNKPVFVVGAKIGKIFEFWISFL